MEQPNLEEWAEFADALIHSRRNISPRHLVAPGPSPAQLRRILNAAAAAPDHRQLLPWRFVVVPVAQRERLARVFGQALADRDPAATPQQIDEARDKAYRAPLLILAIARLADPMKPMPVVPCEPVPDGPPPKAAEVTDLERLVSLGCAIQNMLLSAHAAGFGTGLTSGQAMTSAPLRALFALDEHEHAVCCINIGTVARRKPPRTRPEIAAFVSELA